MPASDILNPVPGWNQVIADSMNPNYGFTRKRATTQLRKKAVGGTPWTRETQNTGHTFSLSWLSRSWKCVQKLRWYYEQYEDGVFTIIDWDGGQRHYVGRFTGDSFPMVESANGMWDVQNLTFEEVPQMAMVKYPNDWANDAVWFYAVNDFGDQKLAFSGDWTLAESSFAGTDRWVAVNSGAIGDWATYEYRGYGFQLWMLTGPNQGIVEVFVDNNLVATIGLSASTPLEPQMVYEATNMVLDIHDVQIVQIAAEYTGGGGGAPLPAQSFGAGAAPPGWHPEPPVGSTPAALPVSWYAMKVMR